MSVVSKQNKGDILFDNINNLVLGLILVVTIYPLVYVISASLSEPMAVMQGRIWLLPENFTVDAYKRVFQNPEIMTGYTNTILYTLVGTCFNVGMTVLGAYPLSRRNFIGRNVIMGFLTFTMFFSGGMVPTYLVIKNLGLINNFWVMILPGMVQMWNLIVTRTFFQNSIPVELYEAASMDGCSNTGMLLRIVLPLSAPILAVMFLFYGVGHWNAFFNAMLYLTDKHKFPLQLILREILLQSKMDAMLDSTSETLAEQNLLAETLKYAVIIVASVPVLMLYPLIQRYFVKGVMVGAIKG